MRVQWEMPIVLWTWVGREDEEQTSKLMKCVVMLVLLKIKGKLTELDLLARSKGNTIGVVDKVDELFFHLVVLAS